MAIIKLNNRALKDATAVGTTTALGNLIFISKQTASSSSSVSFTSGIDSTYKEYIFYFNNIHFSTQDVAFFLKLRDGGSAFDATKTTTHFFAQHKEDDSTAALNYDTDRDLAQSTGGHYLNVAADSGDDASLSGYLHLFDPSNTTFVKHFISNTQAMDGAPKSVNCFTAGYANVTAAIDGVEFSVSSGTIDSGEITLFGVD